MFASDAERRVLGHLPVWTADEEAYQRAELDAGASESIRSYTLRGLTARLLEDFTIPPRTENQVQAFLVALTEKGYAASDSTMPPEAVVTGGSVTFPIDTQYRMTEAGLAALSEPTLADHEQTSGPVQIGTGG